MKLVSVVFLFAVFAVSYSSMAFKDLGLTNDIARVATSLNDIFKESFELMTGSLGKHGVYYLPEIHEEVESGKNSTEGKEKLGHKKNSTEGKVVFHAFNGWLQNPVMKASATITSGSLMKYKVTSTPSVNEVFLVCVECFEVFAESANFCYEATDARRNASGTVSSGPLAYAVNLQIRVTRRRDTNDVGDCAVTLGERSVELRRGDLRTEVRGLRSLNYVASSVEGWVARHLNTTVKAGLEDRLISAMYKVFGKHDMCVEFIG